MKLKSKYETFHSRKCIWKYHLRNGCHFDQEEMSLSVAISTVRNVDRENPKKPVTMVVWLGYTFLTHWGRVTHLCIGKLIIIASDNGLSPGRRQAIIWTNAGILLSGSLGTNFSEILIEIHIFSFKKMHLKMSSGKWRPFSVGLNVLTAQLGTKNGLS